MFGVVRRPALSFLRSDQAFLLNLLKSGLDTVSVHFSCLAASNICNKLSAIYLFPLSWKCLYFFSHSSFHSGTYSLRYPLGIVFFADLIIALINFLQFAAVEGIQPRHLSRPVENLFKSVFLKFHLGRWNDPMSGICIPTSIMSGRCRLCGKSASV